MRLQHPHVYGAYDDHRRRQRPSPRAASGDQRVCPGMQKVFWRQKCPGTRGVRDNRRPGTVLAVPGHLASSQDTYAVLGRCCPKTANCPGTGAGVPGPPSWDTRCPGTPCVPGHFLVLRNAPPQPQMQVHRHETVTISVNVVRLSTKRLEIHR